MSKLITTTNQNIQKQYATGAIKPDREQEIEFREYQDTDLLSNLKTPLLAKERFFLWEGQWRNVNPESEFGALVYDEDKIPPVVFW